MKETYVLQLTREEMASLENNMYYRVRHSDPGTDAYKAWQEVDRAAKAGPLTQPHPYVTSAELEALAQVVINLEKQLSGKAYSNWDNSPETLRRAFEIAHRVKWD